MDFLEFTGDLDKSGKLTEHPPSADIVQAYLPGRVREQQKWPSWAGMSGVMESFREGSGCSRIQSGWGHRFEKTSFSMALQNHSASARADQHPE